MNDSSTGAERVLKFVPAGEAQRFYEFGSFRLDTADRQLYRDGETIPLTPKTLELLVLLVQHHGRIVDKETVMATLWPDTFVDESNLTQHVFRLRKALGSGPEANESIETVPRRGYRFVATLTQVLAAPAPSVPNARSRRQWIFVGAAVLAVAAGVVVMLPAPREASPPSISAEAQEAYLRGRHFWSRRTLPDFKKAVEHFRAAVELEPRFAVAWAGLADTYNLMGQGPRARVAARRALEIDGGLAEAHAALGMVSTFYDFDLPAGAAHLRRAIQLKPNYATAHQWYAFNLAGQGRFGEALNAIERARQIEPLSLIINADVGSILYFARRYEEAIAANRKALDLDPSFLQAYPNMGSAYMRMGRYEEAAEAFARIPDEWSSLEIAALTGHQERARRSLDALEKDFAAGRTQITTPYALARSALVVGDHEKAADWLERAYERHDGNMALAAVDPALDELRGNPRFQRLLLRMRLREN